jgi:sugar phosphate isomerase/epimerase
VSAPIGLQLYTLRDALASDFEGVVGQVAKIGYIGVETAGFPGTTPKAAAKLFGELGLTVAGAHLPLPLGDKKNETLETMSALGCRYLICSWLDPKVYFTSLDTVRRACDLLNEAQAVAAQHGLLLVYHNHWSEFEKVDGRFVYQVMLESLDPKVLFELDTYWAQVAGVDAAGVLKSLGARAPLLHIKDGPCLMDAPQVAVGEGRMDFHKVIGAASNAAQWLIVELDECATDMLEAVRKSYQYLTDNGLGSGRND